jgi:iron complex outermembrane recepter protein
MKPHKASKLFNGVSVIILASTLMSQVALAQQTPSAASVSADDEVTEVVITGSRIKRPELQSANPIISVSAAAIERTGQSNLTEILMRTPALSSSTGAFRSGGGNNVGLGLTGANLLDLRSLGTDRTLVLVNGKRHVAGVSGSAAVDINSIPNDLVEKVDVLTGGASAIYGADGVSGVVNFVMKRDFEGMSLRVQRGVSDKADAGDDFLSLIAGKNFRGGRGNITLAYEYNNADRVSAFARDFTGNPSKFFALLQNQDDLADDPNVFDRVIFNNLAWADSAPDGAIDLDGDFIPDFTGSGLPYDRGIVLSNAGGRAVGGSNTPLAGYYGDLQPQNRRQAVNLLTHYDVSDALKLYAELKYVETKAFSAGQPDFDFYTTLAPDNAYLNNRFGVAASANGAYLTRDHLDLTYKGETVERNTQRLVLGAEGTIWGDVKYDVSYVYGRTTTVNTQSGSRIRDRYYAALDAVDDGTGKIVCRSTLDPTSDIDPVNFGGPATTFTPGANSPCRPLNLLGFNVASQEAKDFIFADNKGKASITQEVLSGSMTGNFDNWFTLPGGSIGYALGAEYRRESSKDTPSLFIQNGEFMSYGTTKIPPTTGEFNVKEAFVEFNLPILKGLPFADLLSVSAAARLSDYSTIGKTSTWKTDLVYAPIKDIRFRATYAQAVRAPNINELYTKLSGTNLFILDPCDRTALNDGTQFRQANCTTILSGFGLTPTQIANFSPRTDAQNVTSRAGLFGGNVNLSEEVAKTWTAGFVIQPRFIKGLSLTADYYNITIEDAINTVDPQKLAELCVDQPTANNVFCSGIFRNPTTGFILGDGNDPQQRIGFKVGPQNVANFKTSGIDFTARYAFTPNEKLGQFNLGLTAGYLKSYKTVPIIGADVDDELELVDAVTRAGKPKWQGNADIIWTLDKLNASYSLTYFGKTRRYTKQELIANPDKSDPKYFFYDKAIVQNVRVDYNLTDQVNLYAGVNNLTDTKPDFQNISYPVSAIGRSFYFGLKVKLN